jgi:3-isopropylmalate dehydrogenase
MVLSYAMMLRYSFDEPEEAALLEAAVQRVLASGKRTRDLMAPGLTEVSTSEMGDALIYELSAAQ